MLPAEYDITGKVVFITGAGRGIGKGIAQVLAEAGADIALNALPPKAARRPDGPVRTTRTAAGGGIAGPLFGVSGIELHDRADDLPGRGNEPLGWAEVGFWPLSHW